MSKLYDTMAQLEKENSQLKEKVYRIFFLKIKFSFVDYFILSIISINVGLKSSMLGVSMTEYQIYMYFFLFSIPSKNPILTCMYAMHECFLLYKKQKSY
jgi:hypothetical protein